MIPLRDSTRAELTPVVNYSLVALNVLVFIYQLSLGPLGMRRLFDRYAVKPAQVFQVVFEGGWLEFGASGVLVTLITAAFLHGGLMHIGGNMLFLWVFGDNVEDRLGHGQYLLFYLTAAVGSNLAQVYAAQASMTPTIGASGAVAGVLGLYFITYPRARVVALVPLIFFFTVTEVPAVLFLLLWFVLQVFYGLGPVGAGAASVAYWAHIGGFVFGVLAAVGLGTRSRKVW